MKQYRTFEEYEAEKMRQGYLAYIIMFLFCTLIWCLVFFIGANISHAETFTYNQLADAIFWSEGGPKAKKPYGILSVRCEDEHDCRQVCLNTIKNNVKRWNDSGRKTDYLSFLANRYAPVGASNDPSNLNKNWLRNVKWFLRNPKAVN